MSTPLEHVQRILRTVVCFLLFSRGLKIGYWTILRTCSKGFEDWRLKTSSNLPKGGEDWRSLRTFVQGDWRLKIEDANYSIWNIITPWKCSNNSSVFNLHPPWKRFHTFFNLQSSTPLVKVLRILQPLIFKLLGLKIEAWRIKFFNPQCPGLKIEDWTNQVFNLQASNPLAKVLRILQSSTPWFEDQILKNSVLQSSIFTPIPSPLAWRLNKYIPQSSIFNPLENGSKNSSMFNPLGKGSKTSSIFNLQAPWKRF